MAGNRYCNRCHRRHPDRRLDSSFVDPATFLRAQLRNGMHHVQNFVQNVHRQMSALVQAAGELCYDCLLPPDHNNNRYPRHRRRREYHRTDDTASQVYDPESLQEEEEEGSDICVICQEVLVGKNRAAGRLWCGHEYHVACIAQWLQYNTICPLCKSLGLR